MGRPWEEAFRWHLRSLVGSALPDDIEAKWAGSANAATLVRALERKAAALPGADASMTIAVCAREELRDVPEGVIAVTAEDIFGRRR